MYKTLFTLLTVLTGISLIGLAMSNTSSQHLQQQMITAAALEESTQAVTVNETYRAWESDDSVIIVDVREDWEWNEVHIPGAVHIPQSELLAKIEQFAELTETIYVYCSFNQRSREAAHLLQLTGYNNVHFMSGGITLWLRQGYPVETP